MREVAKPLSSETLPVGRSAFPCSACPVRVWHLSQAPPASHTHRHLPATQESLLTEDLSAMSLSVLPGALVEGNADIQCCAEELEAQAKLLEDEWCAGRSGPPPADRLLHVPGSFSAHAAHAMIWLCPCCRLCTSQPPAANAASAKAQQSLRVGAAVLAAPAERHGSLDTLQRQSVLQEEEQRKQQPQEQQPQEQQQQQAAAECVAAGECCGEAAGTLREEPVTPQRLSKGDSCWSESPLPGSLEDYAEVQSPGECHFWHLSRLRRAAQLHALHLLVWGLLLRFRGRGRLRLFLPVMHAGHIRSCCVAAGLQCATPSTCTG